MQAVSTAFEQYYSNNDSAYDATSTTCATMAADTTVLPAGLPSDPKNVAPYTYTWGCTSTSFCVCAQVEATGKGNSSTSGCNFSGSPKNYYCVKNAQ